MSRQRTLGEYRAIDLVLFGIMMNQTEASDNKHNRKGSPWKFEQ